MKIPNKRNHHRWIYGSLILYWAILSYIYLQKLNPSPSILIQENGVFGLTNRDLLSGDKILQDISPNYDNLGIVAIRFQTFGRINDDTLIFRLREKGELDWSYTANYKTDQFQDRELFPFGFPIIAKSKGKIFQFEIESKFGSESGHVKVDSLLPVVISQYQYNLHNINLISSRGFKYLILKVGNLVGSLSLVYPIIFYLLPLLFYTFRGYLIILPFVFVAIHRPLSIPQPVYWESVYIVSWIICLLKNKLPPKTNLIAALLALSYSIFQLIENNYPLAEKGAYWVFMFLLLACFHNLITSGKHPKRFLTGTNSSTIPRIHRF